jgi:hypothetical protein
MPGHGRESVAEAIRQEAAFRNVTISSLVEAALAEQIRRHKIRLPVFRA